MAIYVYYRERRSTDGSISSRHMSSISSKEIKRRAEGVQVELHHQTIKQMADYISFSQACLVALAGDKFKIFT